MPYNLVFEGFDNLGPRQVDVLDSLLTRPMTGRELREDTGIPEKTLNATLASLRRRGIVYRRKVKRPAEVKDGPRLISQYHIDWSYLE